MTTFQYTCQDCGKSGEYVRTVGVRKDGLKRRYCDDCTKNRYTQAVLRHYYRNRDEVNTIKKAFHRERRLMVIARLGGKCECCGESHPIFLDVDHINGDGAEQRRKDPLQYTIYTWLVKNNFPPGFRLLCSNCNKGRWRNGGICPHEEGSQTRAKARSSKRSEVPEILTAQDQDMVVSSVKAEASQFEDMAGNIYWPLILN